MFLNLSHELFGLGPTDGKTRQVTSYGMRLKSLPGLAGRFQRKCVDIRPGESFRLCDLEGPGLITRVWITLPAPINPGALRSLSLRMYWDGEEEPSALSPLGDFFGSTFSSPREYRSAYLQITSGAYLSFFPMPFRRRAVIEVVNDGHCTVRLFFFQITYLQLENDLDPGTPYFHCAWRKEKMERNSPPFTVLQARGEGVYLGCHLNMQGAGYPWRLNPLKSQLPEGLGMGMLEGWEKIRIDGEETVSGTGGEDYFNAAWYFTRVPSTGLTHGVTRRSYATRRVSCYRFHVEMPVSFRRGIEVTIDHGLENLLAAVYDGTAFWYQREPHDVLEALPGVHTRAAKGALKNVLIMSAPIGYALAGISVAKKIAGRFNGQA